MRGQPKVRTEPCHRLIRGLMTPRLSPRELRSSVGTVCNLAGEGQVARFRSAHAGHALLLLLIVTMPPAAFASETPAPGRELTRDDRVALTVHRAGLIVIGRVISEHDTTVASFRTFQKVKFAPERRLIGSLVNEPFTFCSLPDRGGSRAGGPTGVRSPERPGPDTRFIQFLQAPRFGDAGEETYGGALQRTCAWYAIEATTPFGYYLSDRQVWSGDLEREVRKAVALQDIDRLIRRSSRIVLGRVLARSGEVEEYKGAYLEAPRRIAVERTLKGTHRARLDVQPVVPFWNQPGGWATETERDFIWLLRDTENGVMEPVELLAGILEVRGGRLSAWGMSLESLQERIDGSGGIVER